MKVSERVYISEILKLQKKRLFCKIQEKKSISRLYCITLPLWNSAFLEIYPYNELLSDIHEGKDIMIVGMAAGRDDAVVMLRRMINDLYHKGELEDVTTYFVGKINEYTIFNIKDHRNPDPDTDRVIVDPFNLPDLLSDRRRF